MFDLAKSIGGSPDSPVLPEDQEGEIRIKVNDNQPEWSVFEYISDALVTTPEELAFEEAKANAEARQRAAGGGVKDPGDPNIDPTTGGTSLPPGFIGGDALLPPSLRTGAVIGGTKGNDGKDWNQQRWGSLQSQPHRQCRPGRKGVGTPATGQG